MPVRLAAAIAAMLLCSALAHAQATRTLSLDAAFTRALEKNPDLARHEHLRHAAVAHVEADSLAPPMRLALDIENAPRSDQDSAFDTAESTLSLASIIERGGKRDARHALAEAQMRSLELEQEQRRADLLAEVARRYLDLLAAQSLMDMAGAEIRQRELMVEAAARRVTAGAAPESVRLTAEAGAVRARLQRDRTAAERQAAAHRLAILWSSREPDFERATGDPLVLPRVQSAAQLRTMLEQSPGLRRFADESRVREARLQLARSASATDIDWTAGIRRLEEDGSWAAVAGFSVPLGTSRRAEPGIRVAQAELTALSLERESEALSLESTLLEAHLRFSSAHAEVAAGRDALIPKLEQAELAAQRAFRAGALTHLEWSQAQSEVFAARRDQLLAAIEAHRALIEIQRLTGSAFVTGNQP